MTLSVNGRGSWDDFSTVITNSMCVQPPSAPLITLWCFCTYKHSKFKFAKLIHKAPESQKLSQGTHVASCSWAHHLLIWLLEESVSRDTWHYSCKTTDQKFSSEILRQNSGTYCTFNKDIYHEQHPVFSQLQMITLLVRQKHLQAIILSPCTQNNLPATKYRWLTCHCEANRAPATGRRLEVLRCPLEPVGEKCRWDMKA